MLYCKKIPASFIHQFTRLQPYHMVPRGTPCGEFNTFSTHTAKIWESSGTAKSLLDWHHFSPAKEVKIWFTAWLFFWRRIGSYRKVLQQEAFEGRGTQKKCGTAIYVRTNPSLLHHLHNETHIYLTCRTPSYFQGNSTFSRNEKVRQWGTVMMKSSPRKMM